MQFLSTLKELSIHPERNSSLILRAEDIQNPATPSPSKFFTPPSSYELSSHLHLQLLPKVPKRDSKLVQHCLFYRTPETSSSDHHTQTAEQGLVVLVPDVQSQAEIPYYHPDVRKLAFHYEALPPAVESAEVDDQSPVGVISISVLPWPQAMQPGPLANLQPPKKPARKRSPLAGPPMTSEVSTPVQRTPPPAAVILDQAEDLAESVAALSHSPVSSTDKETDTSQPNKSALPDRLYRTCLGLLDRLHKHGYGNSVGYKKRREHDVSLFRLAQIS
jgi:tRNASer (uridine44-2'-O)-methyltransferase